MEHLPAVPHQEVEYAYHRLGLTPAPGGWTFRAKRRTLVPMASEPGARQVRVTRGFVRLAERKPGQLRAIDTTRLVVGDHRWGPVGQVYAAQAGPGGDPHEAGLEDLGIPPGEAVDYGFEGADAEDEDRLGQIWSVHVLTSGVEAHSFPPSALPL